MDNEQLYELIAKALHIQGYVTTDWNGTYFCTPSNPNVPRSEPVIYRWLDDDGDSLRLAVKLNILQDPLLPVQIATEQNKLNPDYDWLVATRRAIVARAADIGMKYQQQPSVQTQKKQM